jgi:hypothetical protein
MATIDWKKDLKALYFPPRGRFTFIDVSPLNFLMVDGHGDPNTATEYTDAIQALYTLAYTIKFALKSQGVEFSVAPLEGLWWVPDMAQFSDKEKGAWDWTMMIFQPDAVTAEVVEAARAEALKKKGLPALEKVRLATYHEGLSVQTLYLGAYADEGPTIVAMHRFAEEQGYALHGKHHEIYMGDPRRSAPEKLKTVIRQPVRKA